MNIAAFALLAIATTIFSATVQAETSRPLLATSIHGEALQIDMPERPPVPPIHLQKPWYSVSLVGSELILDRSQTTRRPDWLYSLRKTDGGKSFDTSPPVRHAIDMPAGALLAFRMIPMDFEGKEPTFRSGKYPSLLPLPQKLHDRWKSSFNQNGKVWSVSTESVRRKDGALLAGSIALVATSGAGERQILMPPAHGMAFERQELLWLGNFGFGPEFDMLLKRTWITGEIDYVLKIAGNFGFAKVDLDHPHTSFSQGIEQYEGTATHVSQRRPLPASSFGAAAFSISEEEWNRAVFAATNDNLPKLLFDRQLSLRAERIRITVEYLPTLEPVAWPTPSSRSSELNYEGNVIVRGHFRGKSQTLLQLGSLDGSAFRLQVDRLGDEPALEMSWYPHYNNSLTYYWVWDEKEGRFLRLAKAHAQGC